MRVLPRRVVVTSRVPGRVATGIEVSGPAEVALAASALASQSNAPSPHRLGAATFIRSTMTASPGLNRRLTRWLVLAALCIVFVVAVPASAHAERAIDRDAVGDMTSWREPDYTAAPAPARARNDVRRTALTHGAKRVAIRVAYRELARAAGERQQLSIFMVTNEKHARYLMVDAQRRFWSGLATLFNEDDDRLQCSIRHSINYATNVTTVNFPRRCISNPRWVEFYVTTHVYTSNADFMDDAMCDRALTDDQQPCASPVRLRREPA